MRNNNQFRKFRYDINKPVDCVVKISFRYSELNYSSKGRKKLVIANK